MAWAELGRTQVRCSFEQEARLIKIIALVLTFSYRISAPSLWLQRGF